MANRVLAEYEERREPNRPKWKIVVQRSAAGQPGLFFTILCSMDDSKYSHLDREMTVVVEDGNEFLAPVIEWLNDGGGEK